MTKRTVHGWAIAMMAIFIGFGAGCEGDSGDGGGGGNLVGTWRIAKETTVSNWTFKEDGTFQKNRAGEPVGGSIHFAGTYSTRGSAFSGEFTNRGVGTGKIEGTVSGDSLTMNFIEFWHSPPKVVPCTGVRQ